MSRVSHFGQAVVAVQGPFSAISNSASASRLSTRSRFSFAA